MYHLVELAILDADLVFGCAVKEVLEVLPGEVRVRRQYLARKQKRRNCARVECEQHIERRVLLEDVVARVWLPELGKARTTCGLKLIVPNECHDRVEEVNGHVCDLGSDNADLVLGRY